LRSSLCWLKVGRRELHRDGAPEAEAAAREAAVLGGAAPRKGQGEVGVEPLLRALTSFLQLSLSLSLS
jgi:hypothetical protein